MTLGMRGMKILLAAMTVLGAAATLIFWWSPSIAADPVKTGQAVSAGVVQWGFLAAAIATGLPPKVLPWAPGFQVITSSRAIIPPIGNPLATPLAKHTISGST